MRVVTQKYVSITDYGASVSVADNSTFVQNAIDACIAQKKSLYIPKGLFKCKNLDLTHAARLMIFGEGWDSQLKLVDSRFNYDTIFGVNNLTSYQTPGIILRDLQLIGNVDKVTASTNDTLHLSRLAGVTDMLIDNVFFTGPSGDGIILLGNAVSGGVENSLYPVHNQHVTMQNCKWDGVNNGNRNGISVIDCFDFVGYNLRLENFTMSGEPGVIDLEPNGSHEIIQNITLQDIWIKNCGGGVQTYIPGVNANTKNILLDNINIDTILYSNGISASVVDLAAPISAATEPINFKVNNCTVKNIIASNPLYLSGLRNTAVINSVFESSAEGVVIGDGYNSNGNCIDTRITGSRFTKLSLKDGSGFRIANSDRTYIEDNQMVDCGNISAKWGILLDIMNSPTHIYFNRNTVSSPLGYTKSILYNEGKITPAGNEYKDNRIFDNILEPKGFIV